MNWPDEVKERYDQLTSESKKTFLQRYRRLRGEHWAQKHCLMLCAGLLPSDIKKWPPNLRYRMANKVNSQGLLVGTAEWSKASAVAEGDIREWFTGWFWRNHEKGPDGTE